MKTQAIISKQCPRRSHAMNDEGRALLVKLMDEILEQHPLASEYDTDARYVWPARWEALRAALSALSADAPGVDAINIQLERAFSVLASYGVSRERAKNVANGIGVLATRFKREIVALRAFGKALEQTLTTAPAKETATQGVKEVLELVADHSQLGRDEPEFWLPEDIADKVRWILVHCSSHAPEPPQGRKM
jgi:hypothetical protein